MLSDVRTLMRMDFVLAAALVGGAACGGTDNTNGGTAGKANGESCVHGVECASSLCRLPSFMECGASGACQGTCTAFSPDRPPTNNVADAGLGAADGATTSSGGRTSTGGAGGSAPAAACPSGCTFVDGGSPAAGGTGG